MWGWLKAIGGFFTGGSKAADKVIDMADEAVMTTQEKSEQDSKDTNDAGMRESGPSGGTWFNAMVDGFNRLPRPAFATWAFGELVGWWNVGIEKISPEKMQLIILIITFYVGGRAILKDLPSVIKAFRVK